MSISLDRRYRPDAQTLANGHGSPTPPLVALIEVRLVRSNLPGSRISVSQQVEAWPLSLFRVAERVT